MWNKPKNEQLKALVQVDKASKFKMCFSEMENISEFQITVFNATTYGIYFHFLH